MNSVVGRGLLHMSIAVLLAMTLLMAPNASAVTEGSRFDPLDFTPLGTLNISSGTITFNTQTRSVTGFGNGVASTSEGGENVTVYCFNSVSITGTATINVTGDRPIVILSRGALTIGRNITLTGGSGSGGTAGTGTVGGDNGGSEGNDGNGAGAGGSRNNEGGAGAGYGGLGGTGASSNNDGQDTYGTNDIDDLFGGSGGGGGDNGSNGGGGGAGGGAISLNAIGTLSIQAGVSITVNGGAGAAEQRAGGGGGSGGSIVLSAPIVNNAGTLNARGGTGGAATQTNREGGGGGGGGRIAIFGNTLTAGTTNVQGGSGGTGTFPGGAGANGTVYTAIFSTPPVVTSITRLDSNPSSNSTVRFRITFSRSVQTVVASDLQLVEGGGVSGSSIGSITGSGATRDVTVNTGTGDGTLKLNVLDFDTIMDSINVPLGGTGLRNADFTTGETYTIDKFTPGIALSGPSVSATRNGPVTYTVTYSNVFLIALSTGNITLNRTGTANGTVTVSGSGLTTRTITISGITGDGTIGISIAAGTGIGLGSTAAAGPSTTFTVDNTPPTIAISAPSATVTSAGPVTYTVTYTGADAVSLVAGNITLNRTGTANGTVAVSGTGTATRTVTISGITGTGTIGISVAAGTASDTIGNTAAAAGPSSTFIVDNAAISVSIGAPSTNLTRSGPVTIPITYTNANTVTLVPGNVTLNTTGTATGTVSVSGTGVTNRTITISSITGDGTLSISLAANTAQTIGGSPAPAAGPSASITVDNTAPTVAISSPVPAVSCGENIVYTLTYSGAPAFVLNPSRIQLNTTGSATATVNVDALSSTTHTVTLSGVSGLGNLSITVLANSATDAAGNSAIQTGPSPTATVDTVAPSISIGAPSASFTNVGPVTFTITYTNADTITLSPSDIQLNLTGTANGVASVSGTGNTTRTVTIGSISGEGTIGISIAADTADDDTCNSAPVAGPSATFSVDNTPPSVSISPPSALLTTGGPITYTVTYTDATAITLAPGNITLNTSGTATGSVAVSGSGNARTVTISSITGDGSLGITVNAGTASDSVGNLSLAAGPSVPVLVDNTAPTISIGAPSAPLTNAGPITYTVSYTGADNILLAPGLVTLNTTGTATGIVNVTGVGTTARTVEISGITGDGTLGISIAAASASDAIGNLSLAAGPSATFTVDNSGPTIAIGAPSVSATRNGPVTYTITYTDASAITLSNSDIIVSNTGSATATASVSGSGTTTRTVTFSGAAGDGTIGFTIAAGTASDAAGNVSAAEGPSATFTVDNTGPVMFIGPPSAAATRNGPITYTVIYASANAITLSNGDITLNATGTATGSVAVSGSGTTTRTVTISGIAGDGTLGISIAPGSATDAVGNPTDAAGPSATVTVDNTAPTVSISAPSASLTATGPVTYTVTYSGANAVTLAPGNISLNATGGATGTVSVSGTGTTTRTVTISSITGNGTLGINIAASTASDTAGNTAAAAGPSTIFTVSNTLPSVSIGAPSAAATRNGPVTIPLTFAHVTAVNMTAADVTLNTTGTATGTVALSGSGLAARTVTINGISGNGTLSISIDAGVGQDALSNQTPAAGPSATIIVDNVAPTIMIGSPSVAQISSGSISFPVIYTGADAVSLLAGNVTLNRTGTANGTVAVSGTGTTDRTVTINGITGDGTIGISIAAATASDIAGNTAAAAGPSATVAVDNTGPSLVIGAPSVAVTNDGPVTFTLTYASAASITLVPANISLVKTGTADAVVSVSGSGTTSRTISLLNLTGDGTLRISIAAGTAVDELGNLALAAGPSAAVTVDNTVPVITMLGSNPVTVEWTLPYNDAGATATDTVAGNLTGAIIATSNVNVWAPGAYTVAYNVMDTAGNRAVTKIRTVNVNQDPEDNTVLEFLGRTICRPGICVTINPNVVFTPAGSFNLIIDRPASGVIPAGLFDSILTGTWFDVKPYSIAANNLGTVTLEYGDALARARARAGSSRVIDEEDLFIYYINPETGDIETLDATVNTAQETVTANIRQLGVYAVGAFSEPVAEGDTDADLLEDADEIILGTDPNNIDTDGDGVIDGTEVELGTDPLDPFDFPSLPVASPKGLLATVLGIALLSVALVTGRQTRRRALAKREQ